MFSFSCADYAFPLLSLKQALQVVRLLGFSYVDLGFFERSERSSPSKLTAAPRTFAKRLKEELEEAQLAVSDLFLQIGVTPEDSAVNDPSELVRMRNSDVFARTLELCAELGCAHLTGLPGINHKDSNTAEGLELAAEIARERVSLCSAAGVRYAIEPHIGSLCADIASTKAMLDAVPGLTLTLDYGHFVWAGESSENIHPLLAHASHVHVRGAAKNRLQTSVEENQIDLAGMMWRIQELGYEGFLALEYVWADWQECNRTDNISETVLLRRKLEDLTPLNRIILTGGT